MLRAFLVFLAILVAVLAFVFDRPWLYAAAVVPFMGVLGMVGRQLWIRYRSHQRQGRPTTTRPGEDEELEELGIMDVRPQEHDETDAPDVSRPTSDGSAESDPAPNATEVEEGDERTPTPVSPAPPAPDRTAVARTNEWTKTDTPDTGPEPEAESGPDPSSLHFLLKSVRAVLGAHTVCLLVQEEVVLEYRIEACASGHPEARRNGTFETRAPLLTATMSRQPVTVRTLDEETRSDLGYYRDPPAPLTQMALAPVPRSDDATTVFLVADATDETDLDTSQARSLLEHFAETAQLLLETEDGKETPPARGEPDLPDNGHHSTPDPSTPSNPDPEEQPRPRREIIAEEMEAADAAAEPLALVLVHLNRAEAIARQGHATVMSTERLLRARLEQVAPGQRVERFGELTYGIFVRRGATDVEDWAIDLKEAMDTETGDLEGGVSVGVAVWKDRHNDPEHLRADATEALRESYETGTCAIVA